MYLWYPIPQGCGGWGGGSNIRTECVMCHIHSPGKGRGALLIDVYVHFHINYSSYSYTYTDRVAPCSALIAANNPRPEIISGKCISFSSVFILRNQPWSTVDAHLSHP